MPQSSAERLADDIWRQLRPLLVSMVQEALAKDGPDCAAPESDEDAYIAARVAAQLARFRAPRSRAGRAVSSGHRRSAKTFEQQHGRRAKRTPNP